MSSEIASEAARHPQRQRGRDRVTALTAAATALFLERGFDATTMTEIAGQAGASIGSLYLFFPTKLALAATLLAQLGDALSARLDQLHARSAGWPAAKLADALFDELAAFLDAHPVYAALIDVPGDTAWRDAVRARRRVQIAALFAQAEPSLPAGQAERLAIIVPQLMRISIVVRGNTEKLREGVSRELREMLRKHLEG